MSRTLALLLLFLCPGVMVKGQDTFSIVAVDSVTGEVGAAGASCLDLYAFPSFANDFISELFPGTGAINTQASYTPGNQAMARDRMNAGDSPVQIIDWLIAHDVNGNADIRQYGIVRLTNGSPQAAGYTGAACFDYKNHIAGKTYCIQGNILLGRKVLDSMEARFNNEQGDLACKLMAALQGAKMIGADSRCTANGTSSLFAFVKVARPSDAFGTPSFSIAVKTHTNERVEPVDALQALFDLHHGCTISNNLFRIFPVPASGVLHMITGNQDTKIYMIRNTFGQLVLSGVINREQQLNIRDMPAGAYFIQLQDGGNIISKSFSKL